MKIKKPCRRKGPRRKRKKVDSDDYTDSRVNSESTTESDPKAAPAFQRKLFDINWVFKKSTQRHLCFEKPMDGYVGTEGDSVFKRVNARTKKVLELHQVTQLLDQNILESIHDVAVGPAIIYGFKDSDNVAHMELSSEESKRLDEICRQHDIDYHRYSRKGQSRDSDFIKVAQYGSDDWKAVMESEGGLKLDAPDMVRCLLKLAKDGDKAVKHDSNDNRNSIHVDGGLGNRAYNHMETPEQASTTTPMPVLIHAPKKGKPDEYRRLYNGVGDVLDRLQDYADSHCKENGRKPMGDPFRTEKAGKTVRSACGAERSRFEAFTIGLIELGDVKDFEKTGEFRKKHTIGRHFDGKNGICRGYRLTFVFSCQVVVDGIIYRLAIIVYTRQAVGDALQKELLATTHRRSGKETSIY